MSFFRKETDKVILFVRLTPKAAKDAVEGIGVADDGRFHLKVRVRAVPEDGKANAALVKLLARPLGVAARDISITGGATSRLKQIALHGDPDAIAAGLDALGNSFLPQK
ncbi:MAG: DUF167 family protein [Phyllobacterium sp.]